MFILRSSITACYKLSVMTTANSLCSKSCFFVHVFFWYLSLFLSHSHILHSIGRYWRAAEICSASTSVLHRARATQSHSTDHSLKALCHSSYHWVRSYNHMLSHLRTITRVMNTESGVCLCFLMNYVPPWYDYLSWLGIKYEVILTVTNFVPQVYQQRNHWDGGGAGERGRHRSGHRPLSGRSCRRFLA